MVNIFKIVFTILASFIGAGFASGREIYSFFYIYKVNGIYGIIISCGIVSIVIYKVLKICFEKNINNYSDFCKYIKGNKKYFLYLLNNIINIFLIFTFFIMTAGFASLINQELNINKYFCSIIILIINYFACLKKTKGLISISKYLIPFFILFLLLLSLRKVEIINFINQKNNKKIYNNLTKNNINIINKNNKINNKTDDKYDEENNFIKINDIKLIIKKIINNWIIKSILYSSYNCVLLIPVIITLKKYIKKRKYIFYISILLFIFLLILNFAIFNILLLGNEKIYNFNLPIIIIIQKYGTIYRYIYSILVALLIFTTSISVTISFFHNLNLTEKK